MAPPKKSQSSQSKKSQLSDFFNVPSKAGNPNGAAQVTKKRQIAEDNYEDVWDSPINSPKSAKRKRVIISSDEEDQVMPMKVETPKMTPKAQTPITPRSNASTPKSTGRGVSQLSGSFIHSFRYDKDNSDNVLNFEDIKSSALATPSKTPKKKGKTADVDTEEENQWVHLTLEFLKPGNIKDNQGRPESDPDYDIRTLYVPPSFLNSQPPSQKQWWTLKADYFDTVFFFKVGKFYEMFHMDAVIGAENLGLAYTHEKVAECSFREEACGSYSDRLTRKGFKVARIEQTETPAQLQERVSTQKTKDKVVRRELCRITTQATQTFSQFDSPTDGGVVNTGTPEPKYLMSICEMKDLRDGITKTRFGVSMIDCAIGQFYLCNFTDDASYSTLRTLLAHNQPTQLLQSRRGISKSTQAILNSVLGPIQKDELQSREEFLTASETLKLLLDGDYLGPNIREWPEALVALVADPDEPIPKAKPDCELALSSLGAILWYLRRCLIDVDLVTMKKFEVYTPATILQGLKNLPGADRWTGRRMVLDGSALKSFHLLPPTDLLSRSKTDAATKEGKHFSLFNTINHCITPFGRRMLRQWVCTPSCDPKVLHDRQQSIQFLCNPDNKELMETSKTSFKKVPDLERLFQRIHTFGLKYRSEKHPESRAQFFGTKRYDSQKVRDLCITLTGLEKLHGLIEFFDENYKNNESCPSLIRTCLGNEFGMKADLDHFNELIPNRDKAVTAGKIVPKRGMDSEYDQALDGIAEVEKELKDFLAAQKRSLKCSSLKFFGTGKNRYQLEVPEDLTSDLSEDYELTSKRKGYKRYRTPALEALIESLSEAEKKRDALTDDATRRVFADFDARKDKWAKIVHHMAIFDCLLSLACYSANSSIEMCVPEFDFESDQPYLEIRKGYHPSLASGSGTLAEQAAEYFPNDTILGAESTAPVLLLTGPNMGGKSTLMRQTAVLTVLAQIGSLVPAKKMRLTPVDRVFSRIGASDCIAAGQSTFYVELNETNVILREASQHSLVIIDELGRGTATFDGTAIAAAVLKNLADKLKCRTLFSTHYHSLCTMFAENPGVALGHMECLVENDDIEGDPSMDNVTFLYTLASGSCPKSYGFFTARMAGIDPELVRRAFQASKMIESGGGEQALQKLRALS